jgi:hypothetical protein
LEGGGDTRGKKAQPNQGTQPLLQIKIVCVAKRGKEKIEDQPDATRRAAAAVAPRHEQQEQAHPSRQDRTKIIKLGLIANRNRAPPATYASAAHFHFTVLAASAAATSIVIINIVIIAIHCSSAPAFCMFASAYTNPILPFQLDKNFSSQKIDPAQQYQPQHQLQNPDQR